MKTQQFYLNTYYLNFPLVILPNTFSQHIYSFRYLTVSVVETVSFFIWIDLHWSGAPSVGVQAMKQHPWSCTIDLFSAHILTKQ